MISLTSQDRLQSGGSRHATLAKVRQASFEDYPGIVALQARHGFQTESYDQWLHLWIHNPLYSKLSDWPIGWVLEGEDREIVGYIGNIPLSYEFRGEQIVASTSRCWVVDSRFRSCSFALLSRFFGQKNVQLFINTTVNPYAIAGQKAFRANQVPVGAWDRSLFWITDYRGIATSFLTNRRVSASKLLRLPLAFGSFFREPLRRSIFRPESNAIAVSDCRRFDGRFDAFWEALRISNSHLLLATRSQQMLAWRFQSALDENRAWILAVEDGPRIAAYTIFLRRDNSELGLNRMRLIDFQTLHNKDNLVLPMLSQALKKCQRDGIHMLEVIGFGPEKQHLISDLAPQRRELPCWTFFYRTNDRHLAKALKDPRSWDPSSFDGDASL